MPAARPVQQQRKVMLKQVVQTTPVATTLQTTMPTAELELQLQLETPPRAHDQEGMTLGRVSLH